jgi:hypothetical protein
MEPNFYFPDAESTPILRDFSIFTRYMSAHRVSLTKSNHFIPGKDLFEINKEMTWPATGTTVRTIQSMYPELHFLYHLSLAAKLFLKIGNKTNQVMLDPTQKLQLYETLKPAEKFVFLLEALWVDADWDKIGGDNWPFASYSVPAVVDFLSKQTPGKRISLQRADWKDTMPMVVGNLAQWDYFLLYLSYLGFWSVVPDTKFMNQLQLRRCFIAQAIVPSALGVYLARILSNERDIFQWNTHLQGRTYPRFYPRKTPYLSSKVTQTPYEPFFVPFQPIFTEKELQKTIPRENTRFLKGKYVFIAKLYSNKIQRIEIAANRTLLQLHSAIQHAYNFDDDHLYSFFMDGLLWSDNRFNSPDDLEGPFVDEVCIGDLGLHIGQIVLYLYDFGEMCQIRLVLEEVRDV